MNRMLLLVLPVFCALSAQTPPPAKPAAKTPPAEAAKPAPPTLKDDEVVVVMGGKPWKRTELERLVRALGPTISQQYYNDKRNFLKQFGLMIELAKMAEEEKLDQQETHRWMLYYNRLLYLAEARIHEQSTQAAVTREEEKRYYDEHASDFAKAQVKVLYLTFNDDPPKTADPKATKPRTSEETGKLAEEIVKQARGGADFIELVKKYSDDADSKEKNGDFTPIRPNDRTLPPQIKSAIFALKKGEVSDPVRQAGGYWIIRMEEFATPPYEEVREEIFNSIQRQRLDKWMKGVQDKTTVEFKDPSYLDWKSPIH